MICIYHGGCMDGFGAAWVVRKANPESIIEFIPARYGDDPPETAGKLVYIVDFSYPREVLLEMSKEAELIVIDHHKTAEEALSDLPFAHFDNSKSGAILTWEQFYKADVPPPLFLQYIQDRDLWKWEMDGSREINAAMYSYPMDFDIWDDFWGPGRTVDLQIEGEAILRERQKTIDSLTSGWAIETINLDGYEVPILNCPYWLASEVLNALAKDYSFAISYSDSKDQRTFQLRSSENGVDVSEIAKKYGGGGHYHAAGFTLDKPVVL